MNQPISPTTSIWAGTMFDTTNRTSEVGSQKSADARFPISELRSGSAAAGEVAARISGKRKQRILQLLQERGPLTLWELAEAMSVQVNQISGRLSELKFDGLITTTGLRKHPVSGVMCDVYECTNLGYYTKPESKR